MLWGVRWTQLYLLYTAGVPRQPTRCCGRVVGRRPRSGSLRGWPPSAVGPPRVPRRRRAMWHAHWADSGGWPYGRVGWAAAGVGGRRGCQTGGPARAGPPPREDVRCTCAPRCLSARCQRASKGAFRWAGPPACRGGAPLAVAPPLGLQARAPTMGDGVRSDPCRNPDGSIPCNHQTCHEVRLQFCVLDREIGTVHCLQAQPDLAGRSPCSCDQERACRRPPSLRSRRHGHR